MIEKRRARATRGSGFELTSWYFFRLSGALLLVLALGHILIMHYLNVPSTTDFRFVAQRYQGPIWRTFDWLLLVLAMLHGLNGLRVVVDDYVRPRDWRLFTQSVVATIAIIWIGLGSVVIFSFDPRHTANVQNTAISTLIEVFLIAVAVGFYLGVIAGVVWLARTLLRGEVPIYAGDVGQYAWVLHRATGLGVLFFLLIHVIDIMLIGLGPKVYDTTVAFYANPFLVPMEIALVLALLYHSINGIRIMVVNFWESGAYREREMFYAALALSVLLVLPSVYVLISKSGI